MEEGKEKNEAQKIEENTKESALIEVKTEKKSKGSYFAGLIGAISGGIVASLPWILVYIFASNMVIPIFATLIPLGAFFGYKIFRGKTGKPFPIIIAIISLIIIILVTTLICPMILLLQSNYPVNWENLTGLYSDVREEIRKTIIEDSVAGIVFTVIGIIVAIKAFISKRKTFEDKILLQQEKQKALAEQSQIVKNAFLDLNSMSKENAVKKKQVLKQLTKVYNLKSKEAQLYFINCKLNKILKKYRGKYYYNEAEEQEKIAKAKKIKKRYISKKTKFAIVLIILIIAITISTLYYVTLKQKQKELASGYFAGIKVQADETQDFYGTFENITNEFGEEFASYYNFIIMDKNQKYELYGMEIPSTNYEEKDFATIIKEDRDYFAPYIGEEAVSQVEDKNLGNKKLKAYNYTYTGTNGNQYRAVIYLYEGKEVYLWINVYSDLDIETTQIDTIIENLIKEN